ncbi:MAG TPA: alpha/beta hydrolase [Rhizomicrobium sp.]|nr:alpha/beta hydrolase [Rhizomicrobium sp.]
MSDNVIMLSANESRPAPEARRIIEALGSSALPHDAAEARERYRRSRKPFLAGMAAVSDVIRVYPAERGVPPLAVIRPLGWAEAGAMPALLFLHGGGWTVGDFPTYEPFCRQLANATGCAIVWVEYRLAPEHPFPAPYDDTRAALNWIRAHHRSYGIDRSRIGIAGDSAGGNLAAAVSLAERNEGCDAPWVQLLLYPCLDLEATLPSHREFANGYLLTESLYAWYRRNYLGNFSQAGHWKLSPLRADDLSGLPPAVVLYAGFDPLRDEAAEYAARLKEAGVPTQTLYFPDMIHGFLTMGGAVPAAQVAVSRIAQSLKLLVRGEVRSGGPVR